jgi:hypothetical protein
MTTASILGESWPVLTVRNPWAWALLHGKPVENRSWPVNYRGPLWLHAGARSRWDPDGAASPLVRAEWDQHVRRIPGWPGLPCSDIELGRKTTLVPFGAVTALLEITGCHYSDECMLPASVLPACGRTGCSPWAARGQWHIERAVRFVLPEPVPCRGALGLWRLPEDAERAVREQLAASPVTTVQEARS